MCYTVGRKSMTISIVEVLLGGYECRQSKFQNPSFHILRRKPCPCRYFTIVFALVFVAVAVSIQSVSFVAISSVLCRCFKTMSLVRIYPNRASLLLTHSGVLPGYCGGTNGLWDRNLLLAPGRMIGTFGSPPTQHQPRLAFAEK